MDGFRPSDDSRVNVNLPGEAHYWCILYQCSPWQLDVAVREVGVNSEEVRRYLASLSRGSGI